VGAATEEGLLLNVILARTFNPEQATKEPERLCACQHAIFKIPGFVLGKRLMGIIHWFRRCLRLELSF
jgi:hypothetical protein